MSDKQLDLFSTSNTSRPSKRSSSRKPSRKARVRAKVHRTPATSRKGPKASRSSKRTSARKPLRERNSARAKSRREQTASRSKRTTSRPSQQADKGEPVRTDADEHLASIYLTMLFNGSARQYHVYDRTSYVDKIMGFADGDEPARSDTVARACHATSSMRPGRYYRIGTDYRPHELGTEQLESLCNRRHHKMSPLERSIRERM